MEFVILLIVLVIMLGDLGFSLSRWYKLLYYFINGKKVKGEISGQNKSNFIKSSNRKVHYYNFYYVFEDDCSEFKKGKLKRVYSRGKFESGKKIRVIYLPGESEKSIVPIFSEFFVYETFALIFGVAGFINFLARLNL